MFDRKTYQKQWLAENHDKVRAYAKKTHAKTYKSYYERNKERILAKQRAWRKTEQGRAAYKERINRPINVLKNKIRSMTRAAIQRGELVRGSCRDCGEVRVEAHHFDFSKHLEVIWLCKEHHKAEHLGKWIATARVPELKSSR